MDCLCEGELTFVLRCFIQNEEVLKKCAQEYLARVKQEEQRYQTLKIHAEEKLDKYVHTARTSCFPVKSKCFNKHLLTSLTPCI